MYPRRQMSDAGRVQAFLVVGNYFPPKRYRLLACAEKQTITRSRSRGKTDGPDKTCLVCDEVRLLELLISLDITGSTRYSFQYRALLWNSCLCIVLAEVSYIVSKPGSAMRHWIRKRLEGSDTFLMYHRWRTVHMQAQAVAQEQLELDFAFQMMNVLRSHRLKRPAALTSSSSLLTTSMKK